MLQVTLPFAGYAASRVETVPQEAGRKRETAAEAGRQAPKSYVSPFVRLFAGLCSASLEKGEAMPLFLDVHSLEGVTAEAVAEAHQKDLEAQGGYGVSYQKYWVDTNAGKVFCLANGPDKESVIRVHREAHGLLADEVYEVEEHS